MRILVVEDERDMNRLIVKTLEKAGYTVDSCFDGEEAELFLLGARYDAMLLDVMLPKRDGYSLLRALRNKGDETPVLFLSARDAIEDRVKGLDLGADDYLVKPFSFDELLARIRSMTRKHSSSKSNLYRLGDLELDIESRRVRRGGRDIELLPKEYSILEYMMRHAGKVISREQLENQIWNYDYAGSSNNVDAYMSRLRKKLDTPEDGAKLLHTLRGVGWTLRGEGKDKAE